MTYLSTDPLGSSGAPSRRSNLIASGVARTGTVTSRTVCALLGIDDAFGGAGWFDDLSHSVVSTGSTTVGEISNSGFDDGIIGNAHYLSNDLPNWAYTILASNIVALPENTYTAAVPQGVIFHYELLVDTNQLQHRRQL